MFRFYEGFHVADKCTPYNIDIVRSSALPHNHARVYEDGFHLECAGNMYLLKTPQVQDFNCVLNFEFKKLSFHPEEQKRGEEADPEIRLHFGYDKKMRTSKAVALKFSCQGKIYLQLVSFSGILKTIENELVYDFSPERDKNYTLTVNVNKDSVDIKFDDMATSFKTDFETGFVGISRGFFPGVVNVKDVLLETEDNFEEEVLFEMKRAELPDYNGGGLPYYLSVACKKIQDCYYLSYALDGGTATREVQRHCGYSVPQERFTDPYIRLENAEGQSFKRYLKNGILCFIDPNVYWKYLLSYHKTENVPFSGECAIDKEFAQKNIKIIFGYKHFGASGYSAESGGPTEYAFDVNGNLLYKGESLEKDDIYSFTSPVSGELAAKVPATLFEREKVLEHLSINHYYTVNEEAEIALKIMTNRNTTFLTAKAQLCDVFGDVIREATVEKQESVDSLGFSVVCFKSEFGKLPMGVYRAKYCVYEGDSILEEKSATFEVLDLDSELSPPEASGLPFLYSTPNETAFLENDVFNPWSTTPDLDRLHYFNCCAYTPDVAVKRRTWDIIKTFKRKWYMWFSSRTVFDWTPSKYAEAIKNADFINHQFAEGVRRYDVFRIGHYGKALMAFLDDFLADKPDVAKEIGYVKGEKFRKEQLDKLYAACGTEWTDYVCKRTIEQTLEDDKSIREFNPDFKRADYGSVPIYGNPYGTYWQAKYFGRDFNNQSKVYTGFMQFEDYPYSCAYNGYRGAFCLATINLFDPDLVEHPELYQGAKYACAGDGIVGFARPPFGGRVMPTYYNRTQSYEYVFCTARKTEEGFSYWDHYGFMLRDGSTAVIDDFVKGWKNVLNHKPVKPLKTIAFVTDYSVEDDRYEPEFTDHHNWSNVHNVSEEGQAFLYGCAREAGLPAGYVLKKNTIKTLTPDELDVLVLPSMKEADAATLRAVRKLYSAGVSLVAVSDVTGLEDLFGVKENKRKVLHNTLTINGRDEDVYPRETKIKYDSDGAEVIASSNGEPVMMKYNNTAIINMAVSDIAIDSFIQRAQFGRECISRNFRELCKKTVKELSNPLVYGEDCGLSAFYDESGNKVLVLFDYSTMDYREEFIPCERTIHFNMPVKNVESDSDVVKLRTDDGNLCAIKVKVRPFETAVIKICE
ncbi:MAG: hypothetical protein II997_09080 [Clostridia bacterium]|nr:hypothetical protein [Clostridia bacterium]